MTAPGGDLTVLIPTRNRPNDLRSLLKYLRRGGLNGRIIVADSSDAEAGEINRESARLSDAEHRSYGAEHDFHHKIIDCLQTARSALTVMLPDDDIPISTTILECREFLAQHDEYVAAWGHVLEFSRYDSTFDIEAVRWFTPSIDEAAALARLYHLVRRYQPFFWAVFRTEVLIDSLREATMVRRVLFGELTTLLTAAVRGRIARLPHVYALRGHARSLHSRREVEPLHAFLDDAATLFGEYVDYRNRLADFITTHARSEVTTLRGYSLPQFLDLVHGIGLARELDAGPLNYAAQRALGAPLPPIPEPGTPTRRGPQSGDLARHSGNRRYLWRRAVLEAEPRDEVKIGFKEIERVEKQLDFFEMQHTPVTHK